MVDSLAKLLAIIGVVIAAMILMNMFGHATAEQIPGAFDFVGNALRELWDMLHRIVNYRSS